MSDPRAHVTSLDSLERFRASLLIFLERANLVIDEIGDETNRTRLWLQGDQRLHWGAEIRRRRQKLDEAQAQLLAARISALGEATHAHHQAVRQAADSVKAAEGKLDAVVQWTRHFDSHVSPLTKQVGKLDNLLNGDLQKAVHFLTEAIRLLQEYAESRPAASTPPRPAAEPGASHRPPEPGVPPIDSP